MTEFIKTSYPSHETKILQDRFKNHDDLALNRMEMSFSGFIHFLPVASLYYQICWQVFFIIFNNFYFS